MSNLSLSPPLLRRDGLSTRAYGQSDQAQISIELGEGFDLDNEIDGLRSQVGRLKEVGAAVVNEQVAVCCRSGRRCQMLTSTRIADVTRNWRGESVAAAAGRVSGGAYGAGQKRLKAGNEAVKSCLPTKQKQPFAVSCDLLHSSLFSPVHVGKDVSNGEVAQLSCCDSQERNTVYNVMDVLCT